MKKILLPLFVCLLFPSIGFTEMIPFEFQWDQIAQPVVDMSSLLDPPAGKHGFIQVQDGQMQWGNGERLRIWGINVSSRACFPEKDDAPRFASFLARLGINAVRFHHMDNPGIHLLDGNPDNTRTLNPEVLDRLDFFIAELEKQGVYININLNVARRFKEGDGVREADYLGYAKGATYFNPRLIELQHEYARQLLTHKNPYTNREYRSDPAVVIVEIVNENSLVESWMNGRLQGKNTIKNPGTWSDIPPSYGKELDTLYNKWLREKLPGDELTAIRREAGVSGDDPIPRLIPREFQKASKLRFHTEAGFYMEIEKEFFTNFYDFLKNDLGVNALIVGSSDHSHYRSGYPHLSATSLMDVVDGHVYWQHPNYREGRTDGHGNFRIDNTPMVNNPGYSTVVQLARSAFASKPYTVSETNHPYPNEFACEGIPILGAYALFQDWDGIFFYTFEHATPDRWANRMNGHFDFRPNAMKLANIAAFATTFLRGDIKPAQRSKYRSYSREQVIESIRLPSSMRPFFTPGFNSTRVLRDGTRIDSLNGEPSKYSELLNLARNYTNELKWDIHEGNQDGIVTVDTPKTQALIGFVKANQAETENLQPQIDTPFCTIHCVSMDNKPIHSSSKLLLTLTAKGANTNTEWNEDRTTLTSWGKAPFLVETVSGDIVLKNLDEAKSVTAIPLDAQGGLLWEPIMCKHQDGQWIIPLNQPPTLWYEIQIKH